MTLKAMYDKIADNYNTADLFGSISKSHTTAISQISASHIGVHKPHYKVLDLGVGPGTFLKKLHNHLPHAEFTGVDVSSNMLKHAKQNLSLTTIEASATEVDKFLPLHSQDLVLAHFINAYIPIDVLFHQAKLLTRATGHFSIITTTYDSFPVAQKQLANFIAEDSLISSVIGHFYKTIVKNTTVAANLDELMGAFNRHQFTPITHERLSIPITLNSIEELTQFGIEGTWFLNTLSIKMLPKPFLIDRLQRVFSKIFTFPYHDTHVIDVILAKKQ